MTRVPEAFVNPHEVEAGVRRVEQSLAPDVVRIRYDIDTDWTGDLSVFFRIVLTDNAAKTPGMTDAADHIAARLREELRTEEHGLNAYFNFRSLSEQSTLNEPTWA